MGVLAVLLGPRAPQASGIRAQALAASYLGRIAAPEGPRSYRDQLTLNGGTVTEPVTYSNKAGNEGPCAGFPAFRRQFSGSRACDGYCELLKE
jgi:hypothetical protein